MDLPLETIDEIVEILWMKSEILSSLSLVCSSFRSLCQRRLFSEVSLEWSNNSEFFSRHYDEFVQLFTCNPDLGQYVRRLYLQDNRGDADVDEVQLHWVTYAETLPGVLATMTHLDSFSIFSTSGIQIRWLELKPNTQAAFMSIFASPILTRLALGGIDGLPLLALSLTPQLKRLTLFDITPEESGDVGALVEVLNIHYEKHRYHSEAFNLSNLHFDACAKFVGVLFMRAIGESRLASVFQVEELYIHTRDIEDIEMYWELIKRYGSALHHLYIEHRPNYGM